MISKMSTCATLCYVSGCNSSTRKSKNGEFLFLSVDENFIFISFISKKWNIIRTGVLTDVYSMLQLNIILFEQDENWLDGT